ncbi:MAG TPA: Maf family protein [Polyangiales bacterium]|nr:Maf family protein [Polyangiales bacterium]
MSLQQQRSLVLASGSPRRRDILEQLGVQFRVDVSGIDESLLPGETPPEHVQRLARDKGLAVRARLQHAADKPCVLSADTIVLLDDVVYGKPADDDDALRMLRKLSGRTHHVLTGLALCDAAGSFSEVAVHTTAVTFRELSEATLRGYVTSGEARDKAGAYAIQGLGTGLVRAISGSYTNVVGMPAVETLELLGRAGVLASWP